MVEGGRRLLSADDSLHRIREFIDLCDRMRKELPEDNGSLRSLLGNIKMRAEELLTRISCGVRDGSSSHLREERELALLKATLFSAERERKYVAAHLQDEVIQALASVKMLAENAASLLRPEKKELSELLERISKASLVALSEVEEVIDAVRPSIIDMLGVSAALSWILRKFRQENPAIHVVEHLDVDDTHIPLPLKTDIFRVVEALTKNVAQHSHAQRMEVTFTITQGCLELRVEDNGTGFDETRSWAGGWDKRNAYSGHGILVAHARLRLRGGCLSILSRKGQGTRAVATWPLAA